MVNWKWEDRWRYRSEEDVTYGLTFEFPVVRKEEAEEKLAEKDREIAVLKAMIPPKPEIVITEFH